MNISCITSVSPVVALLVPLVLTGCATRAERTEAEKFSGFLDNYTILNEHDDRLGTVLRWIEPGVVSLIRSGFYDKIYIDDIAFYPEPLVTGQVSRKALDDIAAYLKKTVQTAMSEEIAIVEQPVSGAIRVEAAITGVAVDNKSMELRELLPVRLVFSGIEAVAGGRDQTVQVYLETRVSDAMTGEILALIVRKGYGEDLANKDDTLTLAAVAPIIDQWAEHYRNVIKSLKD